MIFARDEPSPKTVCVALRHKSQAWQSLDACRRTSSEALRGTGATGDFRGAFMRDYFAGHAAAGALRGPGLLRGATVLRAVLGFAKAFLKRIHHVDDLRAWRRGFLGERLAFLLSLDERAQIILESIVVFRGLEIFGQAFDQLFGE